MKVKAAGKSLYLIVLAFICLQVVSRAANAQPADKYWVQFQGDAQHTGRSPYNGPKSEVYAKWIFPAEIQGCSPSIGPDGTIYVVSVAGILYALNPDGTEKWHLSIGSESWGAPAIGSGGTIYVAGTKNGKLYAITDSGIVRWTFTVSYRPGYVQLISGSPTMMIS